MRSYKVSGFVKLLSRDKLTPGDEVVITENDLPVAKLVASPAEKPRPEPGRGKGMLTILVEDEEHLEDFKEYMPWANLAACRFSRGVSFQLAKLET